MLPYSTIMLVFNQCLNTVHNACIQSIPATRDKISNDVFCPSLDHDKLSILMTGFSFPNKAKFQLTYITLRERIFDFQELEGMKNKGSIYSHTLSI